MLKECTEELKNDLFHKKNKKRKISFLEDSNIESVLPESQVSYEEETMEKGETLSSRNIDELQAPSDGDCTPKKHKKRKRERQEFHSTEENENACVSRCGEELETMEKGSSCTGNEMSSERHKETNSEELYETLVAEADDIDAELSFHLRKVGITFSHIRY
jgi:hypothetical protein